MHFEQCGGAFEVAFFFGAAIGLEVAQLIESFVELAGEAVGVEGEFGDGLVGIDDVELDGGFRSGRMGGAREQFGFECGGAVEAPGGIDEFLDELLFGGALGLIFVEVINGP